MRSNWFGLFGILLTLLLVAGPLAGGALADTGNGGAAAGQNPSSVDQSDPHSGHDMENMDMEDMSNDPSSSQQDGSSGGEDHDSGGDSHGESKGDVNTPPNWPVIYGFTAFNLLVIIAAALLKDKGRSELS